MQQLTKKQIEDLANLIMNDKITEPKWFKKVEEATGTSILSRKVRSILKNRSLAVAEEGSACGCMDGYYETFLEEYNSLVELLILT